MARNGTLSAPLLLAIESATSRLSVALLRGETLLAEGSPEGTGHHAERILPLLDAVLEEAGCGVSDPDAFAVSIGPGSFTSLRVGLATVKGLAFGSDRPVIAVPTLEALAFGTLSSGSPLPRVPILDARRGEAYAAVFDVEDGKLVERVPDGLFSPAELAAVLPECCLLVGEGAAIFGEELQTGAGVELPASLEPDALAPRAESVARLALRRLRAGEVADPFLAPRYIRRAEAEATRTRLAVEDRI
ncbi:MAG: tRNA (adenosine(37)-N6)-threonylcarbamoyltransferase complex dimerization subunit type 1 TsaB [Myxococcota bacterium]